jgi:NAD(P)-dependent dehydrogenase (short-subunit alcohol dehydrogenase family)
MIDLTGQRALVTGAGSGIGRSTARALARAGARVAVVELLPERTDAIVRELEGQGHTVLGLSADVAAPGAVDAVVRRVVEAWGGLDILVANAGIGGNASIVEMDVAEWDRVLAVDLDSVFYTVRAAIPALKQSPRGRIVCTASHYGVMGKETMAHYSAAKGGVIGLVRSAALELAPYHINVNAVAPGPIDTNIMVRTPEQIAARAETLPLGRIGQPEDVAGAILYLSSDLASWVTGHVLQVNGGEYLQ